MTGWYEKYYWQVGFTSRLYDELTPESYFESLRRVVALVPEKGDQKIWDAGCGTGLLLVYLKYSLSKGMIYFGSDLLSAGLKQARMRAKDSNISGTFFQNDLTESPPFREKTIDVVVAHFSIYTISGKVKRQQALKNMFSVLKPDGILIICCPSNTYDASRIIEESNQMNRLKGGFLNFTLKRIIFYPITKILGLNFIKKQLDSGAWIAYTKEELSKELEQAGFGIKASEQIYAGGAHLMIGKKEE